MSAANPGAGFGHTWRVRISRGRVQAAGVLVTRGTVLTCAHVVAEALRSDPAGSPPAGTVTVDFPGSASAVEVPAAVQPDGWRAITDDSGGDLALLALDGSPPADVTAATLCPCGEPADRRVRAYGHPAGIAGGVWSQGRLLGSGGPWRGWVQFDGLATPGHGVSRGYSGAGVVDDSGCVIGIVVAGDRQQDRKVAWMIPTEIVAHHFPKIAALLAPLVPVPERPAAPPAPADLQRLAAAMYQIPVMRDDASRQLVVDAMRPSISGAIARRPSGLLDVYSIVRTALDHPRGLDELMSIIRGFSGESVALTASEMLIHEMRWV
jgi:S1-C subfamily serine protease